MTMTKDAALEWLSLVESSGLYLAPKVLETAFPQSLDSVDTAERQRLRSAWEEWRDAVDGRDPQVKELHREWIRMVLTELLGYKDATLRPVDSGDEAWTHTASDTGTVTRPAWLLRTGQDQPKVSVFVYPPDRSLDRTGKDAASPIEQVTAWCRAKGVRNALLTDGERWTLLDAPEGAVSGSITWYARLWWLEPVTLRAFYSLLRARNLFGRQESTFAQLVDDSQEYREEVTTSLGEQVERAVEVLVRALDRADRDKQGNLLQDVSPRDLYEAGLTVMMRLVFILSAEERGLLLLGDPVWDANYAVSTLRSQLEEINDRDGHGVLQLRFDAWNRLLAVFRALYGGIGHESLRLPALGGSLFDPDRFPFLEGRPIGTSWTETAAEPLPINNRTVLLLLNALQKLAKKDGAQTISYRALDVEQIGHVYEGLLERTVSRVADVTLGLEGSAKKKSPDIALKKLESALFDGGDRLVAVVKDATERSEAAIRRDLAREVTPERQRALSQACDGDRELADAILPFANLLRTDPWDEPVVYRKDAFAVTSGSDRSNTGAHYTPKALTERIVGTTLEPVAYVGPAEGLPREEWKLKSAAELLDLKICDPAMGSGAFLVQTCRWLAEKVVQAWANAEEQGQSVTAEGKVVPTLAGHDPMPADPEERLTLARRLVAERCLYGVDINPVAVELAKLSIWLVTLAKNRPFGFLDHNLRHGDSLLGIRDLDQLTALSMTPRTSDHQPFYALNIREAVDEAVELRQRLRSIPIRDIRDVQQMAKLDEQARRILERPELAADALIGEAMRHAGRPNDLSVALRVASTEIGKMMNGDAEGENAVKKRAKEALASDLPYGKNPRKPLHWPLEFPEVFLRSNRGFDAFVGNPPFLGGQKITGAMGTAFRDHLVEYLAEGNRGSADLVAYFFLSCFRMLRQGASAGLLAVNTIAEGDTREVGLAALLRRGAVIYSAHPSEPWPGAAAVATSRVHLWHGSWQGRIDLSEEDVNYISAFLTSEDDKKAKTLAANTGKSFQGSITVGLGFVLSEHKAKVLIDRNSNNRQVVLPYLIGDDIASDPNQTPSRWVINFWDWPLSRTALGSWRASTYKDQREWLRSGEVPEDFPGRVASDFPDVLSILEDTVMLERRRRKEDGAFVLRSPLPEKWWIHGEKRPALYHSIGKGDSFWSHPKGWVDSVNKPNSIICNARAATKYPLFELCEVNQVYSDSIAIYSIFDFDSYAILNSSFHSMWAWKYSSSLETRMRYTPTDCFETFPFPKISEGDELTTLGEQLKATRRAGHDTFQIGLTDLYNRFHDPEDTSSEIQALREVHVVIDERVNALYGFDDLNLEYGFHNVAYLPENDRTRYTVSEKARLEILRRLAKLNQERYEEEQAAQQLPSKSKPKAAKAPKASAKATPPTSLFDAPPAVGLVPEKPKQAVLEVLRRGNRWFKRAEVLQESGVSEGEWNLVIAGLLEDGTVERRGEKRGTEYMLRR